MPNNLRPAEPWHSFLAELDHAAEQRVDLHCLGGFVMTQLYAFKRQTADVDVLAVAPAEQLQTLRELGIRGSELHQKYGVYLDYVTMVAFPEDYEDRLTEMFPGAYKHLHLLALDPYDLALTKLERNIQRDRDDIKHLARAIPFDLAVLKERYEKELRLYLGNPKREDLTLQLWIESIEEERRTAR